MFTNHKNQRTELGHHPAPVITSFRAPMESEVAQVTGDILYITWNIEIDIPYIYVNVCVYIYICIYIS